MTESTSGGDNRGGRKVSGLTPRPGEEGEGLTGLETQENAPESV